MNTGKLYDEDDHFLVDVSYRTFSQSGDRWSGELIPEEYTPITDGDGYVIELDDGRKSRCSLRKQINLPVSSVPPRYHYAVRGYEWVE